MGLFFSKDKVAPPPCGTSLTDVVNIPPLLDKLSMSDLRRLATVSTVCRDAVDNGNLWRTKFAERIYVPHKALRPVAEAEGAVQRAMASRGVRVPPYYKAMAQGWAVYEGILNESLASRRTRVSSHEAVLMIDVQAHMERDLPEVVQVAERLRDVMLAAKGRYDFERAQLRVTTFEHCMYLSLTSAFGACSAILLRHMAAILAADAVALGVGGPAALVAVKVSMTMYCAYFAARAGFFALDSAFHYADRLTAAGDHRRAFQSQTAQLTFTTFMRQYRERYPFIDGQRDQA